MSHSYTFAMGRTLDGRVLFSDCMAALSPDGSHWAAIVGRGAYSARGKSLGECYRRLARLIRKDYPGLYAGLVALNFD